MNLAAFAVIVARERETELGDHIDSVAGIGLSRPWLAWPLTISMLALAGIPATGGFIGKITLIGASVDGNYTWLGIVIVLGSAVSLAYYLRVVAAVWMRPSAAAAPLVARPILAGGSQELDGDPEGPPVPDEPRTHVEAGFVAVAFGIATVALGIVPGPLFDLVEDAGASFQGLL